MSDNNVNFKSKRKSKSFPWMLFGFSAAAVSAGLFLSTHRIAMSMIKNKVPESNQYLDLPKNIRNRPTKLLYLGNVPIEHRLQWTKFRTQQEYWQYYGYKNALTLSFRTLITSTIFTLSICMGFSGLFCWYFSIRHITDVNKLFKSWAKPLQNKLGTRFEMTDYDHQIDKEVEKMNMLEFFENLMVNFEHYEELSQKSLDENAKRHQKNNETNVSINS
eukprot:328442_1